VPVAFTCVLYGVNGGEFHGPWIRAELLFKLRPNELGLVNTIPGTDRYRGSGLGGIACLIEVLGIKYALRSHQQMRFC
jgi:hypothetical protein